MERVAFARALKYLSYKPVAMWSAFVAGVLTSILFVFLLLLLALFADLMVNRGGIPCYVNLPVRESEVFQEWLAEHDTPQQQKELGDKADQMGFSQAILARFQKTESKRTDQEKELRRQLLWMIHLPEIVEHQVDARAGEMVRGAIKDRLQRHDPVLVVNQNLPDTGILSLVVRTRSSFQGWLAGGLARWNSWTWADGNTAYLQGLFLCAAGVALLRTGMLFLSRYLAAWATVEATTRLRRSVYHQTYRLGTLAFRALGPSEAAGITTRHVESLHEGLYTWLTVFFVEPIKFGLLVLFAMLVNFWLALAFLVFAVLVWLTGGQIASYFRKKGRTEAQRAARELTHLQESLMMMRLAKIYLMELFNQNRVERQLRKHGEAQLARYRALAIYFPSFLFLGMFAVVVLLFLVGLVVLHGYLGVTSAMVLAASLVCLYWPVVSFLAARRALRRSRESAARVFEFLDRQGSIGQLIEAEFLPSLTNVLQYDNVSLKEPGTERKLLSGVSFTIKAGERVAVVGPDELEKHALVYLLPRFLDPTSGEIRIDKKNVRWVTLDSLRTQTAMVMQRNLVFNDTVANNIGCGDPTYPLPRVIEAAKVAHAHQFVQKLPHGYETVVGELGHPLSEGEMFLIALARAILRDPAIVVIEEPLTPMHEDIKALVDDTFSRFLPGRTVLFLPHRLSTIRNCDRVYLLYQGKIEATGDHRELLAKNDLYRHLQYLEFNEFAGLQVGAAPAPAEADDEK